MHNDTKIGLGCLVAPPIFFVLILGLWMLVSGVGRSFIQSDQATAGMSILNVGFGLLGIIGLLALPIGIIAGMVFLLRKKDEPKSDNDSHVG
ncbi:MAG: hypothetical protein PHC70_05035 [Patescibacteria group bacterium]|nr:hypothetical protein [Patescibacteria group bacterium]